MTRCDEGRVPSLTAIAFFFADEVRLEVGNKFSFMGMHSNDIALLEPSAPFDRIAILLHMRWPPGFEVSSFRFRIEIPRQEPISHQIEPTPIESDRPAATQLNAILNLRFPPLQPGDDVNVWAIVDGQEVPAGRLLIRASPEAHAAAV